MADQYMQCPQCGGDLVILSDGKRECQNCKMKYMLISRASSVGTPITAEKGEPVTDQFNQCPQCGGELYMLSDGKRQCQNCRMKYMLVSRQTGARTMAGVGETAAVGKASAAAGKKKKKSAAAVIVPIVAAVLLTAAAGGYLASQFLFGDDGKEAEYAAYSESLMEGTVPMVSTGEAAEGLDAEKGDPLNVMGIVEEIGEDYIKLNNGVDCYFDPDTLSDAEWSELQTILGSLVVGDVVGMTGMVSDPASSSFAMKYCGMPYIYYGGAQYYTEYESFRKGIPYPDIAYSEESYNEYLRLLEAGDVPYQTAVSVLDSFKVDGMVTKESYDYGASLYEMHVPMSISGRVEKVTDDYCVVDGVSCFYNWECLDEEQVAAIREIAVNDTVTINGCICNPYVDAFRMHYCYVVEHTPAKQFSVDDLVGSWYDETLIRGGMTIEKIDSETVAVDFGAFGYSYAEDENDRMEGTNWKMTAKYDPEKQILAYSDCVKIDWTKREDESGEEVSTEEISYESGTGYLYLQGDSLYWVDDQEAAGKYYVFKKSIDYVAMSLDEQIAYMSAQTGYGTDKYEYIPVDQQEMQENDVFDVLQSAYVAVFYVEDGDGTALESALVLYSDGTIRELDSAGQLSERVN